MNDKIVISGFADEIDPKLDEQLKVVTGLGMNYISLRAADGKGIADYTVEEAKESLLPRLQAAGVKVSSLGSPIGKVGIEDEEGFEKQLAQLDTLCQICQVLDCRYIRMFSFYIGRRCKVVLDAVGSDHFKAAFDFANFVQCGEDPAECWEMLKDQVVYIHIKDAVYGKGENVVCGTGDGKIPELLEQAICKDGYEGFLTLEPHLVMFDTFKSLETEESAKTFTGNKAANGAEGYAMQYNALKAILDKFM